MDRQPVLHLAFKALDEFQKNHKGQLPAAHNEDHALEVLSIVNKLNESFSQKIEKVDEKIVKLLAYGSTGELAPMVTNSRQKKKNNTSFYRQLLSEELQHKKY